MWPKRVLVVDDEPVMRVGLAEILEQLGSGYVIETSSNGREALAMIRSNNYSLVLTDYKMLGMNGLQLARAIRRLSPDTRVVLMTAYSTSQLRNTALRLELDGYVDKPFSVDQIRKLVERIVENGEKEDLQHSTAPPMRSPIPAEVSQDTVAEPSAPISIHGLLEGLLADTHARCVLLVSSAGYLVDSAGRTHGLPVPSLSALIAADFAAAAELSLLLGNPSVFKASHHEGTECHVYTCHVNEDMLLAVVFGARSQSGAIWFFAKRTAAALDSLTPDPMSTVEYEGDLATDVDAELEKLFEGASGDFVGASRSAPTGS
jgi:CheY-like chemotaxis protein